MKKIIQMLFVSSLLCFAISYNSAFASTNVKSATKSGHTHYKKRTHKASAHKPDTSVINLNKADVAALTSLKGLGSKKAGAIVAYRDKHGKFNSIDDLVNVRGISKKLIAKITKNNPDRLKVGTGS